ncbi:GNAT family N-acetyltransferase [Streptacidiphilus rugosus]|uniref:GNAT family N-acetyltransferase n=1 Tax=Streptacidiphilus rugosus TaxID=405783 RepID=UPI00056A76B4|nr:GNAT family N-acetyltransferase [Streptacidiphilus rugosus]
MPEVTSVPELAAHCGDDPFVLWAAQGLGGRGRAWVGEDAALAAAADISTRDRVAVWARSPEAAAALAAEVLPRLPRSFRPFGARPLIDAVAAAVPGLEVVGRFGWMDGTAASAPYPDSGSAEWLDPDADAAGIGSVLDSAYPTSYAYPGVIGVERWAGVRDDAGRLLAVGAQAWSSPQVALLSGIAVHPDARGKGLSHHVCSVLTAAALTRHAAVGLMVEDWNTPARRVYERLGLRHRPVAAAAFA